MAPRFQTVRQLIFWQYAKLICGSARGDQTDYVFITMIYKKLLSRTILPSSLMRENKILVKQDNKCVYCGNDTNIEWEHVIPISIGGPNNIDNLVLSCKKCNLQKGTKDPFQWYGSKRIGELSRLVVGKFLKLVLEAHEQNGTIDTLGSIPTNATLSDVFREIAIKN